MKNLLFFFIFVFIVACSSAYDTVEITTDSKAANREEIVKQKAKDYIKGKLLYPASFEFSELQLKDSVLYATNLTPDTSSAQDSVCANTNSHNTKVFSYTYMLRFKSMNGIGAKVLHKLIIKLTPKLLGITKC